MIGKTLLNKSFAATLRYVYKPDATLIETTNVAAAYLTSDPTPVAQAMDAIANNRSPKPCYHISLSPAEGDRLEPSDWRNLSRDFLKALGVDSHQTVAVLHNDATYPDGAARPHLHLVINRYETHKSTARAACLHFPKIERVIRKLEQEYGLEATPCSWEVDRRGDKSPQHHRAEREQLPSVKTQVQSTITTAIEQSTTTDGEHRSQLYRGGELILKTTENGYQGHGLTEADGEAVERHERLSNQRHHERELQQQAHERELTLHTTPAPSNPEAAIPQPECPTSAPATSSPVATDFNPHDAARSMLQHFRQHLKKIQKHKKITTPDGYCVTIDQSRSITITRQSSDGTQKVIAQDKKIPEGWKVAIAQVTSAEWQTFERYQAAREKQQAKQRKLGKSKDQGIGD